MKLKCQFTENSDDDFTRNKKFVLDIDQNETVENIKVKITLLYDNLQYQNLKIFKG